MAVRIAYLTISLKHEAEKLFADQALERIDKVRDRLILQQGTDLAEFDSLLRNGWQPIGNPVVFETGAAQYICYVLQK